MANWTSTTYKFYGRKIDITRLYQAVLNATDKEKGNYGGLAHVLEYLGISEDEISDMYLRGHITWVEDPHAGCDKEFLEFQFDCEEAWGTCTDFHYALKNAFPESAEHANMIMDYLCTEPGGELFEHTEGFDQMYCTYAENNGEWNDWYNEDDMLDYINEFYDKKFKTLTDAKGWLEEKKDRLEYKENYMYIHEYNIVEF